MELLNNIQWIVIYPADSAIHCLNNWGQRIKTNFYFVMRKRRDSDSLSITTYYVNFYMIGRDGERVRITSFSPDKIEIRFNPLAPVVQTMDSAIGRINHYPLDNSIGFANVYSLDSDLSGG